MSSPAANNGSASSTSGAVPGGGGAVGGGNSSHPKGNTRGDFSRALVDYPHDETEGAAPSEAEVATVVLGEEDEKEKKKKANNAVVLLPFVDSTARPYPAASADDDDDNSDDDNDNDDDEEKAIPVAAGADESKEDDDADAAAAPSSGEGGGLEASLEENQGVTDEPVTGVAMPLTLSPSKDDMIRKTLQRGDQPVIFAFQDHFSLLVPSSRIRYREKQSGSRVTPYGDSQFVLEETYDPKTGHQVSIRQLHDTSEGVRFLRVLYAIVAVFWTGFLFVFALQILLFVVLDLAIQVGATTHTYTENWFNALGVIFSLVPFVYGLASGLVIAGAFVLDTWRGHVLIRNFSFRKIKTVWAEWLFFAFFLGMPLFVMGCSLLSRSDEWWVITVLFWFSCVLVFFAFFAANVIFYEIRATLEISRNAYNDENQGFFHVLRRAILLRQVNRYSGVTYVTYLSLGSVKDSEETDKAQEDFNIIPETRQESVPYRTRVTQTERASNWRLYQRCRTPEEVYTIDDARDVRPYVTSYSWTLEKVFCRPRNSRYVAIVKGPGAVTRAQMRSSFLCSLLGSFLIFFLLLSALVYLQFGAVFLGFAIAVCIIVALPSFVNTYKLYKIFWRLIWHRSELKKNGGNATAQEDTTTSFHNDPDNLMFLDDPSDAVYLVQKCYRVTRPTATTCWILFVLEIFILFLWPMISLFAVENWPLALVFIVVAGFTAIRHYINASVVLEEMGHLDLVDGRTAKEKLQNQARLSEIVGNITRGRSRGAWMAVLGFIGFIFVGLFVGAVGQSQASTATDTQAFTYLPDFEYEQKDSLRYPSCRLTSDIGLSPLVSLADFAFLAGLAYRSQNLTQSQLDGWFQGAAVDRQDVVTQWRATVNNSQVSMKLITFPGQNNFSYVAIRGTTNAWDALTDAQLWSGAILMQILRFFLPAGEVWTPIIDRLIYVLSYLQSASIDEVSFYRDTTAFVQYLKNRTKEYPGLAITGHSLGGGLAMISGAQTGIPAVAMSGPNAMLSKRSFIPEVSKEDLDSKTFNVIPSRDVVPMIDDRAQNFQQIRCETAMADVIGCHTITRTLCEIIYSCGTQERPAICECVTKFGYPEPVPKIGTNRTFAEACNVTNATELVA